MRPPHTTLRLQVRYSHELTFIVLISGLGRKWEEIRGIYLEQISGLEILQAQVQDGLENLKTESEHLKRIDDTIHRQREQLRLTFDEFERKQTFFNDKGWFLLSQVINCPDAIS